MGHDELAEVDLTEAEIDAMMADGKPVDIVGPPLEGGIEYGCM